MNRADRFPDKAGRADALLPADRAGFDEGMSAAGQADLPPKVPRAQVLALLAVRAQFPEMPAHTEVHAHSECILALRFVNDRKAKASGSTADGIPVRDNAFETPRLFRPNQYPGRPRNADLLTPRKNSPMLPIRNMPPPTHFRTVATVCSVES